MSRHVEEQVHDQGPKFVCMIAGKENHGKERNPLWGVCRYCCTYCPTKGKLWINSPVLGEYWHKCNPPKCNRLSCDFCAWRCTPVELVFIDIFGEEYEKEVYKENINRREKMVSNTSPSTTDLP